MHFHLLTKKIAPLFLAVVCAALSVFTVSCRSVSSQNVIDIPAPLSNRSEQILYRKAYIVSYNSDTRQANWVAWRLTSDHVDGHAKRPQNAWHEDLEVSEPRAYYYDYKGSGYDHGHLCPAGDNKWDTTAMYESFLMTNCTPQNRSLNSGLWNQIEQSCRKWAKKYGEVIIICGPIFMNCEHDTIGPHRIPVPEAFFKVVVSLDPTNPKGIGFICRNTEGTQKRDFYTNSINEVERITGITFFPNIDPTISKIVKNNSDIHQW